MFINSSKMVVPYLICFYFNLPSARKKSCVNGRPTYHGTSPPRRDRNPKSLASCINFVSAYVDPLAKTHGHLRMPSTPGVRDRSHHYIMFPARHTMPTKCIKLYHSAHGPGCGSVHARPTSDARAWMYARKHPLSIRASLAV